LKDPLEILREYLPPLPHELFESPKKKRKKEESQGTKTSAPGKSGNKEQAIYCAECFDKHLGGSHTFCREGLEWYEREDHELTERIQKKFRAIRSELAGMKDDIFPGAPKELEEIYNKAQRVRKEIWSIGLPQGLGGTSEDMRRICVKLKELQDRTNEFAKEFKIKEVEQYEQFI